MLKNMTRKGLALGAGIALAASGLVATPAQATATGLLWSALGQTNEMVGVAGYKFTVRVGNPAGAGFASNSFDLTDATTSPLRITQVPVAGQASKTLNQTDSSIDGAIELAVPSPVADETYMYDIYVLYSDGSRSETERITFLPKEEVSASLSLDAFQAPGSANQDVTGYWSLSGINTQNFVQSNFTIDSDGTIGSGEIGPRLTTGADADGRAAAGAAIQTYSSANTYTEATDRYSVTFRDTAGIQPGEYLAFSIGVYPASGSLTDINVFFDADATASSAKRIASAADSYEEMEISIGSSTSITHNNTGTASTLVPSETVVALEGTKSLVFTISLFTDTTMVTRAGANNAVTVTLTDAAKLRGDSVETDNSLGTTTITVGGQSLKSTDASETISFTSNTNSSGQISFTVTADKAEDGEGFKITAQGTDNTAAALDTTYVLWEEAAWTVLPALADDFTIAPKGSLTVDYTVVDQFGNLANADYQLAFTRDRASGTRTVAAGTVANWSYVAPVSAAGKASVTIVDNGAAATEGKDTVTVTLQKKASAGGAYVNVTPAATDTFAVTYENDLAALTSTAKVSYDGIANAAGTAIAPIYIETDPLVNFDSRISNDRTAINKWSDYNVEADGVVADANDAADALLRVFGNVVTTNNAPVAGVAVKISGTGLNFADKSSAITRASNDSIVVFTDATGSYEAFVRSSVAGRQTISVDAQGATSSVAVRFQESTGVATTLTLDVPASVNPGARADFVAKVVDKFGKPVSGVTVYFKDNGPGVLSATSAATDPFGDASVTLTTLAAESGTTTVTAWATIGGQTVSVVKTITVGSAAGVTGKVNVGSFNGKLVVYAAGLQGSTISWKVGGNWGKGVASSNYSIFNRPTPRAGVTVSVDIYVNGVKTLTKSVVTR